MRVRIVSVFILFVILWSLLILRAAYLQIVPNDRLAKLQQRQFNTAIKLNARRGIIYDSKGKELAASVSAWSLYADPQMLKDPTRVGRRIARLLREDGIEIQKKLKDRGRRFVWLARRIAPQQKEEIESWREEGLGFVEEPKRIYPYESLLGQVLGFTGEDGRGLEGLELKNNGDLQGNSRTVVLQKDAHGRPLLFNGEIFSEAPEGSDLHLTVDSEIQHYLEQELVGAVEKHKADSAVGIVLDPRDSAVLAMASVPLFNPNSPGGNVDGRRNRVVTDPFEPGSTLKTLALAGALREGLVAPNTKIDCGNGSLKIGRRTIREADAKHKWASLSVSEILAVSSNVGSARIALMMGDQRMQKTLRDFGIGEKTGLELPGESKGILPVLPWREHLMGNISFGHGLALTPIQVANAYAAIANGGVLNKPYIVSSISNSKTGFERRIEATPVRRVLTEKEAAIMRLMLMGVTAPGGTGTRARVSGFPVAGKTGTAQKASPNGGYVSGAYVSNFAGFLPASDPKFVIFVAVDNPRVGYYGSDVAAPVFASIGGFVARRAGLVPSLINEKSLVRPQVKMPKPEEVKAAAVATTMTHIPELQGLSLREALLRLKAADLKLKISGRGRVAHIEPSAGSPIPENRKLNIRLE